MTTRADLVTVGGCIDHAQLAMQAAEKLRRARRQSQKEKMGQAVCHHLLCMLEKDSEPTAREKRLAASRSGEAGLATGASVAARANAMARSEEPQLSMAF